MQSRFIRQTKLIIFEKFNFNLTMKKLNLLYSIYILFALFTLHSCSDVEPLGAGVIGDGGTTGPVDPVTNGNFKVDFDGQTFVGFANQAMAHTTGFTISSVNSLGNAVQITTIGYSVGTYQFGPSALGQYSVLGSTTAFFHINPADPFAPNGELILAEVDTIAKTVSGTFHFTGYESDFVSDEALSTKEFTNGIFTAIPYTGDIPVDNGGGPGVVFENFFAKVNGENFLAVDDFVLYGPTSINNVSFDSYKAVNDEGDEITINIKANTPVGTYNITAGGAEDKVQIKLKKGVNVNKATAGQVKITVKTATNIKATFSGVVNIAGVTYTITAGQFKANL